MTASVSRVVVASTFTATPILQSLRQAFGQGGPPPEVVFVQYARLSQFLLAPESVPEAAGAAGVIVLVRLEDWLRGQPTLDAAGDNAEARAAAARALLGPRGEDLLAQIQTAASRGTPLLVMVCASQGWFATKRGLGGVCTAVGNVLVTKLRGQAKLRVAPWHEFRQIPGVGTEIDDPGADRMGQIPFSQACFDALGRHLGGMARATFAGGAASSGASVDAEARLRSFLMSLSPRMTLSKAAAGDVTLLGDITRAGTEFRLHTRARSDAELTQTLSEAEVELFMLALKDKHGSYEHCGLLEWSREGTRLRVRDMVLTCPVLGKQAEDILLVSMARRAAELGATEVALTCENRHETSLAYRFLTRVVGGAEQAGPSREFVFPVAGLEKAVLSTSTAPDAVVPGEVR